MSGETQGELAEAIAVASLKSLPFRGGIEVFWEKRPTGALVMPDITVGLTTDEPTHVFLVTACDTPRSSAMKYWRNIGEIFDSKKSRAIPPIVISLVFNSGVKEELLRLEASIVDSMLLIDRDLVFGPGISEWLQNNHERAPSSKDEKLIFVGDAMRSTSNTYDELFENAMLALAKQLKKVMKHSNDKLSRLWQLCHEDDNERRDIVPRKARQTLFRRGIARWVVLDEKVRSNFFADYVRSGIIRRENVPNYARKLEMVVPRLGGFGLKPSGGNTDMISTTGEDMATGAKFFVDASRGNVDAADAGFNESLSLAPEYMLGVAEQLRRIPGTVEEWHAFVGENWSEVIEPKSLYRLLTLCHRDQSLAGRVSVSGIGRVWLYDHCIAILRAKRGNSNDFGYGPLGQRFQRDSDTPAFTSFMRTIIESMPDRKRKSAIRWTSTTLKESSEPGRRGFQDWLSLEKDVSPVIVAAYAYALASLLREVVGASLVLDSGKVMSAHAYSSWNKLLTYPEYEGLPGLVMAALGDGVRWTNVPTLMAEVAGATVQDAGSLRLLRGKKFLCFWVSATDAGKTHKVKELCAKAYVLRYEFLKDTFGRRNLASRLVLIVDGTFSDDDLAALARAGWDEIYYPDEMSQFSDAVG